MTDRLSTADLLTLYEADLGGFLQSVAWLYDVPAEQRSTQQQKLVDSADEISQWLELLAGPADGDPRLIGWIPRIPITGEGVSFQFAFFGRLSRRPGITIYRLDGSPFRAASMSTAKGSNSDPLLGILGGQEFVDGKGNEQWNLPTIPKIGRAAKPCWNGAAKRKYWDIPYTDGTYAEIEEAKNLIRNYAGGLRFDYRTWRPDLAALYAEGHPDAQAEAKGTPLGPKLPGMLGL